MKAFDLIDSVSFGYRAVWLERRYLFKLALVPIFIKLVSTIAIMVLGYEDNYLRQALISLPSAFAEGWLLAQFLRTLLLLERWPIILQEEPNEKQMSALLIRARGIMSSTILYALITFLAYGLKEVLAIFYDMAGVAEKTGDVPADPKSGNPLLFIPALGLIFVSVWVFRFLWLYIPVVVLMPIGEFLKKIGGFMASLRMMAVFLICMVPCFLLALVLSGFLASFVGGANTDIGNFITIIISVTIETLISLITTAAMAYALKDILPKHPKALPDINEEQR